MQGIRIAAVLMIVFMMISPMYVRATVTDEVVREVDYAAISGADEVQNNLDDGSRTNYDTWDPIPSGVWYGGWAIESQLRLSAVPDDDFSIGLATVAKFGSEIIMSGAARTVVRLPIFTSDDPWTRARLNIYEINEDTNWTFQRDMNFNTLGDPTGAHHLNDMKINFSGSYHELIFYSLNYNPDDISPTDGDDHFTRANRTYAIVDAPIKPDTYYLFVTYVWYDSDKYVEIFLQPDSLTNGDWDLSTVGVYNEFAPDSYQLQVQNLSVSLGYSFDFQNGFGNSAYGLNLYMYDGDGISFWSYVDPTTIKDSHYLSFMLPFRSSLDNISWTGSIYTKQSDDHAVTQMMGFSGYMTNDFLLISMEDIWSNNVSGLFNGWFRISLTINNDTRLWLPLWDLPPATGNQRMGLDWFTDSAGDFFNDLWETNTLFNYNVMQNVQINRDAGGTYTYFWMPQHSIQFNSYYWDRSAVNTGGTDPPASTETMTFTQKIVYGVGSVFIKMGDVTTPINYVLGTTLRAAGTAFQLVAQYSDFPDPFGYVWDKIQNIIAGIQSLGQWIWRVVQEVVGAIRWFVETVTYFISILLGILLVVAAMIILFLPMWFAAKFGQIIVMVLKGKHERAIQDLGNIATGTTGMIVGRGLS